MTKSKSQFVVIALFAISFAIASCGTETNKDKANAKTEQTDKQGKEYTSAYVCPMHCEGSGSEQPGECPVCGMEYVKNEATAETYACPMHPEMTGAKGDKCSECGMDMTAMSGHDHEEHDHEGDGHEGHDH